MERCSGTTQRFVSQWVMVDHTLFILLQKMSTNALCQEESLEFQDVNGALRMALQTREQY
jgi:hypothetical protein